MAVEKVKVKKMAEERTKLINAEAINMAKKISGFVALVFVMLGALFTWALYRMVYVASGDILSSLGIVDDFYQNGLIVLITGTLLYLGKKDIMKLLK